MESCSSSVATDQTDRCSNFSVISSLSQVFPHSLDHQSIPTNHLTQLHELSTMNGTEEDLSSILKREEVDLPGLHGAVNETTRRSRRPGRVRPRIRLKTEQVRCYRTNFHNLFQQKSLAEKDRIHLEKTLSEAAWQGETITQLKRRELFLTRWWRERTGGAYSTTLISGRRVIWNRR